MKLEVALQIVSDVVGAASAPISVSVTDAYGEVISSARMDGAPPDTALNAHRKAYTVARSSAASTRELRDAVSGNVAELVSFDPSYCFFLGGVAIFDGDIKIGAVGVSGLTGDEDEALAIRAVAGHSGSL